MTRNLLPPLARQALDRDYLSRENPDLFKQLRGQSNSLALLMHAGKVRVRDLAGAALVFTPLAEVPVTALLVYLGKTTEATQGIERGTAICLAVIDKQQANSVEPDESRWLGLRSTGAGLSDLDAGVFTQALALNNWHRSHTHCPGCGSKTTIERAGWVRRCEKDDLELFPRTDPAIIVSILDQHNRILLGSQGIWEENRWSVLAGFVEPGESLEAAVVREMNEECGLDVVEPEYIYSQSWPYPYSLMLSFTARADSSQQLKPDGQEIVRLRWFSAEELLAEAGNLLLPGRATISRAMIELWAGQEINSATENPGHGQR